MPHPIGSAGLVAKAQWVLRCLVLLLPCVATGVAGSAGEDKIQRLIERLKDQDERVRIDAFNALYELGPEMPGAILALVQASKEEPDAQFRELVVRLLGAIGAKAPADVVPTLMYALEDPDEYVREEASCALSEACDANCRPLLEALSDTTAKYRQLGAIKAFGCMEARASSVVPLLVEKVKDQDPEIRKAAIDALARIRDERPLAMLLDALVRDPDVECRSASARYFGHLGAKAEVAVPILVEALAVEDESLEKLQVAAAAALRMLGPIAAPSLRAALRDPNQRTPVRREAVCLLGAVREEALASLPVLVAVLRDKDEELRGAAASALGRMGPQAVAALHPLKLLAQCGTAKDRLAAAEALYRIDPYNTRSVLLLASTLKEPDESLRLAAIDLLKGMGWRAEAAALALGEALKDNKVEVRLEAARALQWMGTFARDAGPALKQALQDEDPDVRRIAAAALNGI